MWDFEWACRYDLMAAPVDHKAGEREEQETGEDASMGGIVMDCCSAASAGSGELRETLQVGVDLVSWD